MCCLRGLAATPACHPRLAFRTGVIVHHVAVCDPRLARCITSKLLQCRSPFFGDPSSDKHLPSQWWVCVAPLPKVAPLCTPRIMRYESGNSYGPQRVIQELLLGDLGATRHDATDCQAVVHGTRGPSAPTLPLGTLVNDVSQGVSNLTPITQGAHHLRVMPCISVTG
eukprot:1338212-Amphidinium_carterae.1